MKLIEGFDSNYRYILVAAGAPANYNPEPRRWFKLTRASPAALRRTKFARAR